MVKKWHLILLLSLYKKEEWNLKTPLVIQNSTLLVPIQKSYTLIVSSLDCKEIICISLRQKPTLLSLLLSKSKIIKIPQLYLCLVVSKSPITEISGLYVPMTKPLWIPGFAPFKLSLAFLAKQQKLSLPKKKKFYNLLLLYHFLHPFVNTTGTTMNMVKIGNADAMKAENKVL